MNVTLVTSKGNNHPCLMPGDDMVAVINYLQSYQWVAIGDKAIRTSEIVQVKLLDTDNLPEAVLCGK